MTSPPSCCKAQQSHAKILGIAGGPPDNVNFIKLGKEFGILQHGQQFAGLLMLITDVHALGLPAAQGLLLTTGFYWDMDDPARAWSKRFFEQRHAMPTTWQAGVYSSVTHYLKRSPRWEAPMRSRSRRRCARCRSTISSPTMPICAPTG